MAVVESNDAAASTHPSSEEIKPATMQANQMRGLLIQRRYTKPGVHPFNEIQFESRTSRITEPDGRIIFEMKDVEVPSTWSQLATDILVSKYFRKAGVNDEIGHEHSAKQVVTRIANTIRKQGEEYGVFSTTDDAEAFEMELSHLLITQKGAFNSPVWFNCGLYHQYGIEGSGGNYTWDTLAQTITMTDSAYKSPQCSACFIQSVKDDLMGIFDLAKNEARLFKYGSGTGTNFSNIRGKQEKLSSGGTSSGLMSFLEVFDRAAGATKSGGTTRRAAKMVTLDMDHPEIVDFIWWKVKEERKAKILIDGGLDSHFDGEAYKTVSGQNSNNSVRLNDKFMNAVLKGDKWHTTERISGKPVDEYDAKDLMHQVAQAAWECADPGVQFDDIINDWHTCLNTDRIYGSNPCSEYHFLNNTACNLASINLMKFVDEEGKLDIEGYRHACRIFFIAQEILVDFASYPTEEIALNSHNYRPLGLGYANLGTLLMINGIPYDSEEGRAVSAAITAIMTGHAYKTSAELSATLGSFPCYEQNESSMIRVMEKHRDAAYAIQDKHSAACPTDLFAAAKEDWDEAVRLGKKVGYRNAQATVIAPTGTIGLLMDCDTTGIEPDFSLVKWKKLAGGGYFKIVNQSLPRALRKLQYSETQIADIITYILGHGSLEGAPYIETREKLKNLDFSDDAIETAYEAVRTSSNFNEWTSAINPQLLLERGLTEEQVDEIEHFVNGTQTIEGAPHLKQEHYPIFDCANKCGIGERFLDPMAHIRIMAATQPFISGAISKTVNLPNEATVEDIEKIYVESWKMGLKCVALYRDGSKFSQPLTTGKKKKAESVEEAAEQAAELLEELDNIVRWGEKRRLPRKRNGINIEANVAGHKVHLRTGEYETGELGEIFIDMFKEGAAYRSMVNCFAVAVSLGLQYGVPLEKFVESFTFTRFEPAGMTDHPNVKQCTSLVDYIFRVLGMEYLGRTDFVQVLPDEEHQKEIQTRLALEIPKHQAVSVDNPQKSASTGSQKVLDLHENNSTQAMNQHMASMMGDAPPCSICGSITVRNGSCYKCTNCGNSEGCS